MNYSMMWRLRFILCFFQLDSSDEQAAAIRRELDARREKVSEMERVSVKKIICVFTFNVISEPEADAKVCAERHGRIVH